MIITPSCIRVTIKAMRDVPAEIDENFMSLILTLKKEIAGDFNQCKDSFAAQALAKFGEEPTCSWSPDRKLLTVMFGS